MRHTAITLCVFLVPFFLLDVPPLDAAELAGAELDDTTQVGDETLVLNGLGLRKKAIFKVYVAGLYLPEKNCDGAAILAADETRHLVMAFVRSVGKGSLTGAWDDCLKNNTPDASSEIKRGFKSVNDWMVDVQNKDRISFTYVPGTGVTVEVGGETQGPIEGKPFADALFACWIGEVPPSEDFKKGLLGG
ncbi:MAG: chalcone isomerase family protein [Thermoanaerobaculia bacterium]|nr:chalcone isomerase family protein [Thermoanaerobaculia bacterium]